MIDINRRSFLFGSAAAAALAGCSTAKVGARELKPGEKRNVAMIGIGIQGRFLLTEFLKQPNVRVVAICDVDKTRREDSAATVNKYYKSTTRTARSARPTPISARFSPIPRSTRSASRRLTTGTPTSPSRR